MAGHPEELKRHEPVSRRVVGILFGGGLDVCMWEGVCICPLHGVSQSCTFFKTKVAHLKRFNVFKELLQWYICEGHDEKIKQEGM